MPCIDRNARARLLYHAEALDRRTRLPGQHGGVLKRTGLAVFRTLLLQFANVGTGRCDPGFDTLARVAGVCRSTVAKALDRLEAAGLLRRVRRQCGTVRYTNAYVFPWSEFRPETTNNKKTNLYSELSTGEGNRSKTGGTRVQHGRSGWQDLSDSAGSRGHQLVCSSALPPVLSRLPGERAEPGPGVLMAVALARIRAQLGDTHAVFARLRAERAARERAQRAPG